MASKNLQTLGSEDASGLNCSAGGKCFDMFLDGSGNIMIVCITGSSISTLAASTRDESTSSPEQNQMRTESQRPPKAGPTTASIPIAMRFSPDRKDALDLEAICPLKTSPHSEAPPLRHHEDRGPPLSADLLTLGNRDRRSKSEER